MSMGLVVSKHLRPRFNCRRRFDIMMWFVFHPFSFATRVHCACVVSFPRWYGSTTRRKSTTLQPWRAPTRRCGRHGTGSPQSRRSSRPQVPRCRPARISRAHSCRPQRRRPATSKEGGCNASEQAINEEIESKQSSKIMRALKQAAF